MRVRKPHAHQPDHIAAIGVKSQLPCRLKEITIGN